MALTKHQRLARGIKSLLEALDLHHHKTAEVLNALQFHFYEPYWIAGAPIMTERAFQAMINAHRCGLSLFSSNEELQTAARDSPLFSCIIPLEFYSSSRVLVNPPDAPKDEKQVIPWGVKIILPSETLLKLNESKLEALLYCAAAHEMSEWIDWFEQEDKSGTLVNQLLAIDRYYQERAPIEKNLSQPILKCYRTAVLKHYKKIEFPKVYKTLVNIEFAPKEQTTIAQAYELVTDCLRNHRKRHHEDFQRFWRDELEELIFAGLNLAKEQRAPFLQEYFPEKPSAKKSHSSSRWKTGHAIDRQTYAAFINHFAHRFLENPLNTPADGEIVLLLWVMVYIAQAPDKIHPIKRLLELTTANLSDRILSIDNHEIEFSCGLADLIQDYMGEGPFQRQQKLFPNLTIDKLEDYFHRASEALLPPGAVPVLPEAFLSFPHPHKHSRMIAQLRRRQQEHPAPIYHDPISRQELKLKLIEKSQKRP